MKMQDLNANSIEMAIEMHLNGYSNACAMYLKGDLNAFQCFGIAIIIQPNAFKLEFECIEMKLIGNSNAFQSI